MKKKHILISKIFITVLPVMLLACGSYQDKKDLNELLKEASRSEEKVTRPESEGPSALQENSDTSQCSSELTTVFVHICGEVVVPGVYEVYAESRICDVLNLAGGFTDNAETRSINLAEQVKDGMMVVIPSLEQAEEELLKKEQQREEQERAQKGLIDLNNASLAELCTISGIGKSRAEAIIRYREDNGGFTVKEDIMQVSGIKVTLYEMIKDSIFVSESSK